MSSLEMNKVAAAILTAGVVAMTSGFVARLLVSPHELEENVYVVAPAAEEEVATGEAAEPALEPVAPLLAAADPGEGEKVARKCSACHTFEQGGANKIGPNLWGIVGAPHAQHADFGYSNALQAMAGEPWTYEDLNAFLAAPKDYAPGTKMSFAGIKKVEDRAAVIAYLRSLSDNPVPLPE